MASLNTNKDISRAPISKNDEMPIVSSRVRNYRKLLERNGPTRELTQKYQSHTSILHKAEPKVLSYRSSDRSSQRGKKHELRKKLKPKSKSITKSGKYGDKYNSNNSPADKSLYNRGTPSFTSNSKTKSTDVSSSNPGHNITGTSSRPGSLSSSRVLSKASENTRNTNPVSKSGHSLSSNANNKRFSDEHNFTSADLKSQYLTHSSGRANEGPIESKT